MGSRGWAHGCPDWSHTRTEVPEQDCDVGGSALGAEGNALPADLRRPVVVSKDVDR